MRLKQGYYRVLLSIVGIIFLILDITVTILEQSESDGVSVTAIIAVQCLRWLVEVSHDRHISKSSDCDSYHTVQSFQSLDNKSKVYEWAFTGDLNQRLLQLNTRFTLIWSVLLYSIWFYCLSILSIAIFYKSLRDQSLLTDFNVTTFKIRYSGIFAILNLFRFWN